ncbi:Kelch repeat-containing protein [Gemmatimonadota bacterium]
MIGRTIGHYQIIDKLGQDEQGWACGWYDRRDLITQDHRPPATVLEPALSRSLVILVMFLVQNLLFACSPTRPEDGTWRLGAELSRSRSRAVVETVSGRIFVIGGVFYVTPSGVSSPTEIYDPSSDTWSDGASIPTARVGAASGVYGGKVYVFAGSRYINECTAILEIYNPESDSWSSGSAVPDTLDLVVGAFYQNRYYLFGYDRFAATTSIWVYDPVLDSWAPEPTYLPDSAHHPETVEVYRDKLCLALIGTILVFDVQDSTVEPFAAIENGRFDSIQGVVNDSWVLTGGWSLIPWEERVMTDETSVLRGSRWIDMDPLPKPVYGASTCTVGNRLYVMGGLIPSADYYELPTRYVQILTVR